MTKMQQKVIIRGLREAIEDDSEIIESLKKECEKKDERIKLLEKEVSKLSLKNNEMNEREPIYQNQIQILFDINGQYGLLIEKLRDEVEHLEWLISKYDEE